MVLVAVVHQASGGVDALGGAGGIRSIAGAVDVESHGGAGATGAAGRKQLRPKWQY